MKDIFEWMHSLAIHLVNTIQKHKKLLPVLCLATAMLTIYTLRLSGESRSNVLSCPLAEHQHSTDCYLTCTQNHEHTSQCYSGYLQCGTTEHIHTPECFDTSRQFLSS